MIACIRCSCEDPLDQLAVSDIALVKRNIIGHGLAAAVRQIVDDGDRPARIDKSESGVASDITGAAGDEYWELGHE